MATRFDQLPARVREVRVEKFGPDGVTDVARALGIPNRTWMHIESGVIVPAGILLQFLILTGTEPLWLLTGEGERYRPHPNSQHSDLRTAQ